MYKILNDYGENLRLALFENKFISARYEFENLNQKELWNLADEIVLLAKKEKFKIAEFEEKTANTCHIDKIKGEIRYIRPYVLAQILRLHNKINYDRNLPPEFFAKDDILYMINTIAFNIPEGSSSNCNMGGLDRILYGLNVFESGNYENLILLHTKEFKFKKECKSFIKRLNCGLGENIIKIQSTEISEKLFDKKMFDLIEKISPIWKKGTEGNEYININIKDNLKRFEYFKIYD